jgi:hypothetical protein
VVTIRAHVDVVVQPTVVRLDIAFPLWRPGSIRHGP